MSEEFSLLIADSKQALFDEIKSDAGATNGTRYEIGRAIGLMGRVQEELATLRAQNAAMKEALEVADDAINEMFRYFDGGETRGSYDGKPERAQLRKAGYATSNALAQVAK